jgi:hypothetical protein
MNKRFAISVLSVLLYAQGLLGFAGVAAVLLKNHAGTGATVASISAAPADARLAVL